MARANFQAFAVDSQGNILSGASVEVRDTSGALLASSAIFTGYTGSSTVSSNPFTVGSDGLIQFYVEGSQVLTITATSGANTATWSNVVLNELFTPSDYALNSSLGTAAALDTGTAAGELPTNGDLGTAAQADLTTSATDKTAGRVLKVGDGGLLTNLQVRQSKTAASNAAFVKIATINTPSVYDRLELFCRVEKFSSPDKSAELKISCSVPNTLDVVRGSAFLTEANPADSPVQSVFTIGLDVYVEILDFVTIITHAYSNCDFTLRSDDFVTTDPRDATEIEFQIDKIWTDRAYQPETSLGVGVTRKMKNKSGAAIADQGTIAGSSLKAVYTDSSGVEQESAVSVGGTWVNVSGMSIGNNEAAEFTKL